MKNKRRAAPSQLSGIVKSAEMVGGPWSGCRVDVPFSPGGVIVARPDEDVKLRTASRYRWGRGNLRGKLIWEEHPQADPTNVLAIVVRTEPQGSSRFDAVGCGFIAGGMAAATLFALVVVYALMRWLI